MMAEAGEPAITEEHDAFSAEVVNFVVDNVPPDGHDIVIAVWHKGYKDEPQAVLWPMTMHKHGPECFRG